MQLVRCRELVRLRDRRDEDDLVLLGHHGDGGPLRRGEGAHEEVDVVLQDHLAGHPHGLVGLALGVAHHQLHLAAEDAALGVDLVHEHLGALGGGLAEESAGAGEDDGEADLDRLLRARPERHEQRDGEQDDESDATVHA